MDTATSRRLRSRIKLIRSLRAERVLYLLGALAFGITAVSAMTKREFVWWSFAALLVFTTFGVAIELARLLKKDVNRVRARVSAVALVTGSFVIARIWARHVVNDVTAVDPSKLELSVLGVAVIMFPFVFCLAISAVLGVSSLLFMVWSFVLRKWWNGLRNSTLWRIAFKVPARFESGSELDSFGRVTGALGALVMFGIVVSTLVSPMYSRHLLGAAEEIVIRADYFRKSHCAEVAPDERLAFVGDGEVSIAKRTPKGVRFSFRGCKDDGLGTASAARNGAQRDGHSSSASAQP